MSAKTTIGRSGRKVSARKHKPPQPISIKVTKGRDVRNVRISFPDEISYNNFFADIMDGKSMRHLLFNRLKAADEEADRKAESLKELNESAK